MLLGKAPQGTGKANPKSAAPSLTPSLTTRSSLEDPLDDDTDSIKGVTAELKAAGILDPMQQLLERAQPSKSSLLVRGFTCSLASLARCESGRL